MRKGQAIDPTKIPLLSHPTDEASVFLPENLLARSAAMQRKGGRGIPRCCLLDFDGELVPVAQGRFGASPSPAWSCFHTTLLVLQRDGFAMGLIGGTVGAPFAVLVSEQLIASGCRHIIGYSSAGAIGDQLDLPCLVVPDRAIRDEGTSYHYLPPAAWVEPRGVLPATLAEHAKSCRLPIHRGATWTTDAPYRESETQIRRHRAAGALSVEMEAAALMALAQARHAEIASLVHVTNALGTNESDFNKGPEDIHNRVIVCCFATFRQALESGAKACERGVSDEGPEPPQTPECEGLCRAD